MLSVKAKMTLDLAGQRFTHPGGKEAAIRELFGESPNRFYQRLDVLLDSSAAMAYDAPLVKRLRRQRDLRTRQRIDDRWNEAFSDQPG